MKNIFSYLIIMILLICFGCVPERTNEADPVSEEYNPAKAFDLVPRTGHKCVIYESKMFIIGGSVPDKTTISPSTKVDMFNFKKRKSYKMADMNEPRSGHQAILIDDRIFVFGGIKGFSGSNFSPEYTTSIEEYSIEENKWKIVGQMPVMNDTYSGKSYNVVFSNISEYNDRIYYAGGMGIYIFDPENYTFANKFVMFDYNSMKIGDRKGVIYGSKIYTFNSWYNGPITCTSAYDIKANTWTQKTPNPAGNVNQIDSATVISLDEKVYFIGGQTQVFNSDGTSSPGDYYYQTDVYNIKDDSWSTAANIPVSRIGGDAVLYDGKIYHLGCKNHPGPDYEHDNDPDYFRIMIYNPEKNKWKFYE